MKALISYERSGPEISATRGDRGSKLWRKEKIVALLYKLIQRTKVLTSMENICELDVKSERSRMGQPPKSTDRVEVKGKMVEADGGREPDRGNGGCMERGRGR